MPWPALNRFSFHHGPFIEAKGIGGVCWNWCSVISWGWIQSDSAIWVPRNEMKCKHNRITSCRSLVSVLTMNNLSRSRHPIAYLLGQDMRCITDDPFNLLHAKFFIGNINIYLQSISFLQTDMTQLISFLHTDMTQVAEILPRVWQGPTYFT